jgi:hypothetical protein
MLLRDQSEMADSGAALDASRAIFDERASGVVTF